MDVYHTFNSVYLLLQLLANWRYQLDWKLKLIRTHSYIVLILIDKQVPNTPTAINNTYYKVAFPNNPYTEKQTENIVLTVHEFINEKVDQNRNVVMV